MWLTTRIGWTGSGVVVGTSSTISLPFSWRTRLPGRGAERLQPSQPKTASWTWIGESSAFALSDAAVPWMKPSSGEESITFPAPTTEIVVRRQWSDSHRFAVSSHTSIRRPRVTSSVDSVGGCPWPSACSRSCWRPIRSSVSCAWPTRTTVKPFERSAGVAAFVGAS